MHVDQVCRALCATVSPDLTQRCDAETYLNNCRQTVGFPLLLLQLVQEHCTVSANDQSAVIRSSAAIYLKNLVEKSWEADPKGANEILMSDHDRNAIKAHMVKLLCECGSFENIRQQLSQALSLMAASDFPGKWESLLPEIVKNFEGGDRETISGMLLAANSILKRFRFTYKSDALYSELKYVLEILAAPLTALLMRLGQELDAAVEDQKWCKEVLESLRLACRIFYSLNWQDLPEFFEDHMAEWMGQFEKYLGYKSKAPQNSDDDECIVRLQSAIMDNISLFAQKYEEEFTLFLPRFVSATWQRLVKLGLLPKHDRLAAASIRFLAEVAGKQMHTTMFMEGNALSQVIEAIVLPNMSLQDSDVELFEDSPLEYISRDFEGADAETRRRGACDLITALCKHHNATTTRVCGDYIAAMLQKYAESPSDHWRSKDTALHLVISLTGRAEFPVRGLDKLPDQINILDMYSLHIVGEIAAQSSSHPIILADAIKFVCTFRNHIPPEELVKLLPLLGWHLGNTEVVIRTYAAACIERTLAAPGKIAKDQIKPMLTPLFEALLAVPEVAYSDSTPWENEYAMKAVMRLLVASQESVIPIVKSITEKLCNSLTRACINPRNPRFIHYLFESLAILVRVACRADGSGTLTNQFEQTFFPQFQVILQMDIVEFAPYVFQILALILWYKHALSDAYASLLPALLHPALWERCGNVPALSALLEAYLAVGADQLVASNQLEPILGVFQKLLASKISETHAFDLLKSIILHVDSTVVDRYIMTILQLLLTRLQQDRDRCDLCHKTLSFLGLLAGKRGGKSLASSIENHQTGLLANLILHVFAPKVAQSDIANPFDAKAIAIGATRILCEAPDFLVNQGDPASWRALGAILVKLLRQISGQHTSNENFDSAKEIPDGPMASYDATFSKLHFGSKKVDDAFLDIHDVKEFALSHLQQLANQRPHFQPLVSIIQEQ